MSTTDRWGRKVELARMGPENLWREVAARYAEADDRKWKSLAMLALRVNAGWSLEMIGHAFRHNRGHVCRIVKSLSGELREAFERTPDMEDGVRR